MEDVVSIYHCSDPKRMIAEIFHVFASHEGFGDLKYFSYPALLELYLGVYQMVENYFSSPIVMESMKSGSERAVVKRWLSQRKKRSMWIPKSCEGLFKRIFEDIFRGFGCGVLHGFSSLKYKPISWKA